MPAILFNAYTCPIRGKLSRADTVVLAMECRKAKTIYEFGIGASTYLIHQNASCDSKLVHTETEQFWIDEVKTRLPEMLRGCKSTRDWVIDKIEDDHNFDGDDGIYDLIFVDGFHAMRPLALRKLWLQLRIGGVMLVHDGRHPREINQVHEFLKDRWLEIESFSPTYNHSNMMRLVKCEVQHLADWTQTEKGNNRLGEK